MTKVDNGRWEKLLSDISRVAEKEIKIETKEVSFPDVQKVSGKVDVKFPDTQKITGKVGVDFPEVQKIKGKVKVDFPDTQKVSGKVNIDFPDVQKVSGDVNVNFPDKQKVEIVNVDAIKTKEVIASNIPVGIGEKASAVADPTVYVPVRLTNGKTFIAELGGAIAASSGSTTSYVDENGLHTRAKTIEGRVQVDVISSPPVTIDTSSISTSDNQTNGAQKTQIVDSSGESITSDDNKLDVMAELIPVLRSLIIAIANPSYVDKSANQMRAQVTGSLTTVTTVTNLTNIGTFGADHLQRMANITAWTTNVRNLIT